MAARRWRATEAAGRAALVVGATLLTLACIESGIAILLRNPEWLSRCPRALRAHVRGYYMRHDRVLVQSLRGGSRYDPELFYTLQPGMFRFRNREFDTQFIVNSLGVRDEEQALQAPEIVVLGDSFAMGWGVRQWDSFPGLLTRRLKGRVLNAGVASYGTVRERRLLERIDTRKTRLLIVQYEPNDFDENKFFAVDGNKLKVSRRVVFDHVLSRSEREWRYLPGRYLFSIVTDALTLPRPVPAPPAEAQAQLFLNALINAGTRNLSSMTVLAFELAPLDSLQGGFARALQRECRAAGYPDWARQMIVLDLSRTLTPDDYFVLDDHLRPSGHARVADRIASAIGHLGFEQAGPD